MEVRQLGWLKETANRLVTLIRRWLSQAAAAEPEDGQWTKGPAAAQTANEITTAERTGNHP